MGVVEVMGCPLKIIQMIFYAVLRQMIRIHRGTLRGVSPTQILLTSIQHFRIPLLGL